LYEITIRILFLQNLKILLHYLITFSIADDRSRQEYSYVNNLMVDGSPLQLLGLSVGATGV
jgi:hypothetical protein